MGQPDKDLSLPLTKYRELARNKQKKCFVASSMHLVFSNSTKRKSLKCRERSTLQTCHPQ